MLTLAARSPYTVLSNRIKYSLEQTNIPIWSYSSTLKVTGYGRFVIKINDARNALFGPSPFAPPLSQLLQEHKSFRSAFCMLMDYFIPYLKRSDSNTRISLQDNFSRFFQDIIDNFSFSPLFQVALNQSFTWFIELGLLGSMRLLTLNR